MYNWFRIIVGWSKERQDKKRGRFDQKAGDLQEKTRNFNKNWPWAYWAKPIDNKKTIEKHRKTMCFYNRRERNTEIQVPPRFFALSSWKKPLYYYNNEDDIRRSRHCSRHYPGRHTSLRNWSIRNRLADRPDNARILARKFLRNQLITTVGDTIIIWSVSADRLVSDKGPRDPEKITRLASARIHWS